MRVLWPAAIILAGSVSTAFAWGQEGHSIIAEIAQRRLTQQATALVERLLGKGHSLASIASWADDARDTRPNSYNWHFVDIPLTSNDYVPERDCKADAEKGDCVLAEIDRARHDLACAKTAGEQTDALKDLVHFVGDLHQPLHTVGDEKGGNTFKVDLFMRGLTCVGACTPTRTATNLHEAWDTALTMKTVWDWGAYVDRLEGGFLASREAKGVDAGKPVDWLVATHRAAQYVWFAVPADKTLNDDYYHLILPILDRQLGTAGLRLARMLNETAAVGCTDH